MGRHFRLTRSYEHRADRDVSLTGASPEALRRSALLEKFSRDHVSTTKDTRKKAACGRQTAAREIMRSNVPTGRIMLDHTTSKLARFEQSPCLCPLGRGGARNLIDFRIISSQIIRRQLAGAASPVPQRSVYNDKLSVGREASP